MVYIVVHNSSNKINAKNQEHPSHFNLYSTELMFKYVWLFLSQEHTPNTVIYSSILIHNRRNDGTC